MSYKTFKTFEKRKKNNSVVLNSLEMASLCHIWNDRSYSYVIRIPIAIHNNLVKTK